MPWWFNYPGLLLNAEVEYPCLSGERRHLPCINFKDSARPAELPLWLSWYSICLGTQKIAGSSPAQGSSFSLEKKELSSCVVACICLVSITDYSCTSCHQIHPLFYLHFCVALSCCVMSHSFLYFLSVVVS